MTQEQKEYLEQLVKSEVYQDVECINYVGETKSYRMWNHIKDLVDWKDKTVIDAGSFLGYFCFKVYDMGAKSVVGLDHHLTKVKASQMINDITQRNVEFRHVDIEKYIIPKCDILLSLNVFHYIKDLSSFLDRLNFKKAIFRVTPECVNLIRDKFIVEKELQPDDVAHSHRTLFLVSTC